jgi:hypothetical protein
LSAVGNLDASHAFSAGSALAIGDIGTPAIGLAVAVGSR